MPWLNANHDAGDIRGGVPNFHSLRSTLCSFCKDYTICMHCAFVEETTKDCSRHFDAVSYYAARTASASRYGKILALEQPRHMFHAPDILGRALAERGVKFPFRGSCT